MLGNSSHNYEVRKKLIAELRCQSHLHGGCNLVSNATTTKGFHRLRCQRFRIHKEKMSATITEGSYRPYNFTNDRHNGRGKEGKKLKRQHSSGRASSKEETCKASILIAMDKSSFYMTCGYGCPTHTNHPRLSSDGAQESVVSDGGRTPEQSKHGSGSSRQNSILWNRASMALVAPGKTASIKTLWTSTFFPADDRVVRTSLLLMNRMF